MSKKSILLLSALALSTTSFIGQPIEKWKDIPTIKQLTSFGGLQTAYAKSQITVKLDGKDIVFLDTQPQIIEGRTLVPVRGVFEEMGFKVDWNGETKTASLSKEGQNIEIVIGNSYFTLNGEQKNLDIPAQVIEGRTMLPLRAISEATNAKVDWDANTKTVTIITGKQEQVPPVEQPDTSNLDNSGSWIPTDGFTIPGVSQPLKVLMTKDEVDSILGKPIKEPKPDSISNQYFYVLSDYSGPVEVDGKEIFNQMSITYNDNFQVKTISSYIPGTTVMGLKVGDPYPVEDTYDLSKFPKHVWATYAGTGAISDAPILGLYFYNNVEGKRDMENEIGVPLPGSHFNKTLYIGYTPNRYGYGKQEYIDGIDVMYR